MNARRGEVWLVDLDPVAGHEQAGRRPAVVLSVDAFNASHAELVALLPVTSKPRRNNPFRVEVLPPEGGLSVPSYVICEQTRTVSTRRLVKRVGTLTPESLAKVAAAVRVVLGL